VQNRRTMHAPLTWRCARWIARSGLTAPPSWPSITSKPCAAGASSALRSIVFAPDRYAPGLLMRGLDGRDRRTGKERRRRAADCPGPFRCPSASRGSPDRRLCAKSGPPVSPNGLTAPQERAGECQESTPAYGPSQVGDFHNNGLYYGQSDQPRLQAIRRGADIPLGGPAQAFGMGGAESTINGVVRSK
jgi:hypothetical protein